MWNYNDWLLGKLVRIAKDMQLDIDFHVFSEQDFVKSRQVLNKNSIFVIVKTLSTSISYNTKIRPLQLTIFTEQDSLKVAFEIFKAFANQNNFSVDAIGSNYIKHQYNEPVVLQNFVQVGTGYRSIIYVSATLYEMENVVDAYDVSINDELILPIEFSMAYTLSTDTQPMPNTYFVKSVRTTQSIVFTLTIPAKKSAFLDKVFAIIQSKISGDETFTLKYKIKNVKDEFSYQVKLSGYTMITAPSSIPSIQIGLVM